MNKQWIRAIVFVLTCLAVLVLPWWCTLVIVIAETIYFPLYLEALIFGFMFDSLYSAHYMFPYTWLMSAAIFVFVVMFAKNYIRT